MKRAVLFIGYEPSLHDEISEYMKVMQVEAHFSDTRELSIRILKEYPVGTVVLSMHQISDAAILKYINQYYPEIKVLVSASDEFDDVINVFSRGKFHLLSGPLKLKELGVML